MASHVRGEARWQRSEAWPYLSEASGAVEALWRGKLPPHERW